MRLVESEAFCARRTANKSMDSGKRLDSAKRIVFKADETLLQQ
jgi:hypothetical protein